MMTWKCGFKFKLFDWSSVLEGGSLRRADPKPFLRDPLPVSPHSFHSIPHWEEACVHRYGHIIPHTYIHILFHILFHYSLLQNIEFSSLYYIALYCPAQAE